MIDSLQELLKIIGVPGVITTIILLIARSNPITSMSSSWLEIKLATKEKRFYIKSFKFIFEVLFYLILFLLITDLLFKNKSIYNPLIAIIVTVLVVIVFFYVFGCTIQEKNFFDLYRNKIKRSWELVLLYIVFLTVGFLGAFLLPAYFLGTQLYSQFYNETLTREENYGALLAYIIISIIYIISIYPSIILTYYKFLNLKNSTFKNLVVKYNNEYWYIHHPIQGELFLLGDKAVINECTRFRVIERNDLQKELLLVQRK
ncbi:hypothetical protein [Sutcliffiella horikoshii]|uniref:hypothetical protein n=1 Tax=Sutcliffiella horikoshii TaxID=79883 RepID=UPI003CF7D047